MSDNQEFSETFKKSLEVRGEILGERYVTNAVESLQNEYFCPAQVLVTECAWGTVWTRPGLDRNQRSLLSGYTGIIIKVRSNGSDVVINSNSPIGLHTRDRCPA
ncbi:hypothetical protein BGZ61DRAFT_539350 [Ilyonectria robusta]|uniref:uncharacterized protein n=1 Tax=Ilyonectria robusta TaxID=1079257 RepID=UPI001E8EE99C|nr:uncharacterized protein BGZ61DRAFT_539350 [Ilyonectria robusta]KAH8663326.1 hypothetical protein BGZ61DRAFT_539350 [Ilyonectria robusta]